MKTILTYYKNSNTNEIVMSQEFTEIQITGIPIYYYRNNKQIEKPDMSGYVKISEKHYKRIQRKLTKKLLK